MGGTVDIDHHPDQDDGEIGDDGAVEQRFADDREFGEQRDRQRRHGSCRVALHRSVKNLQLTLIIDSRERVSDLAEPVQLKDLMGVDCRPEFIFGVSISSVSVRMVHLEHQFVASSNFLRRRVLRKTERFEGFCFQYLELTPLEISFRSLMSCSNLACVKGFCRTGANGRRKRHLCRLIKAGPPRLTAAVCCFPLIAGGHRIRQIAREIISLVVFPRMLRAEQQVQTLRISPNGRAIGAAAFATVPLAFRLVRLAERS